jgi:hypothetical protein
LSQQLISTSKLFLFGLVLIGVTVIGTTDFDTSFDTQNAQEDFDIVVDDWFKMPSLDTADIVSSTDKSYQFTVLSASAIKWNPNDCDRGNCYEERNYIQSYTSESCDYMIEKWNKYPDWILTPLLAEKILEVCDI